MSRADRDETLADLSASIDKDIRRRRVRQAARRTGRCESPRAARQRLHTATATLKAIARELHDARVSARLSVCEMARRLCVAPDAVVSGESGEAITNYLTLNRVYAWHRICDPLIDTITARRAS